MGLSTMFLMSGCGGSTAARDTAEAVVGGMFKQRAGSPEQMSMLKSMPEYNLSIDCTADRLEQVGWDQDQHDFFMAETNQTGNPDQINMRKFSEAEQKEHFEAVLVASGSCFEQLSR